MLTIAASNYYGFSTEVEDDAMGKGAFLAVVRMLFDLMSSLGQPFGPDDIDWIHSNIRSGTGTPLFINTVGSETWRPVADNPAVTNLFLAGDYCRNPVGLATVEGAVVSGLLAAKALHEQQKTHDPWPVDVIRHAEFSAWQVNAMKLAAMPGAYWAKWWSATTDVTRYPLDPVRPSDWATGEPAVETTRLDPTRRMACAHESTTEGPHRARASTDAQAPGQSQPELQPTGRERANVPACPSGDGRTW